MLHRATREVWRLRLPRVPRGMGCEVRWKRGATYTMGGSFGVERMGDALVTLTIPAGWEHATTIAITLEPAPGTRVPTSSELIAGAVARAATT